MYGRKIDFATDLNGLTVDDVAIDPGARGELSVLGQVKLLKGRHVHLDLIRVGLEEFTLTDEREIDIAVQFAREIHARHGLGIGRVSRWFISVADADGYLSIDSECEAFDLIDDWYAPGDGIDVFFVQDLDMGLAGATPTNDPEGVVVEIQGNVSSGVALAHELGHYWGLEHVSTPTNLMLGQGFPMPPYDLSGGQLDTIHEHDSMHGGCP